MCNEWKGWLVGEQAACCHNLGANNMSHEKGTNPSVGEKFAWITSVPAGWAANFLVEERIFRRGGQGTEPSGNVTTDCGNFASRCCSIRATPPRWITSSGSSGTACLSAECPVTSKGKLKSLTKSFSDRWTLGGISTLCKLLSSELQRSTMTLLILLLGISLRTKPMR